MIVVIRNPRNGYYGASVAGPVFRELADMVYANDLSLHRNFADREVNFSGEKIPHSLRGSQEASRQVYTQFGLQPQDFASELSQKDSLPELATGVREGVVPDVCGMGLTDALFALENAGFKARVKGHGVVKTQSLPEGAKPKLGSEVLIQLK